MGRRARNKKDPPAESVNRTEYAPSDPQFWMYGGPWVHPDDIPPRPWKTEYLGGGMKGEARERYVREIVESYRRDLGRQTTRYLALREEGMDALEEWIKERWRRAVHAGSNKPTDPDPVSEHLAYGYRDIAHCKGKIAAAERLFAEMERAKLPLFHWND